MGTSAVEYRDRLFWAEDALLRKFLAALAATVRSREDVSSFLSDQAGEWERSAAIGGLGCVNPCISDDWDESERREIVDVAGAIVAAQASGQASIAGIGRLYAALLEGTLEPDPPYKRTLIDHRGTLHLIDYRVR